MKEIRVVVSAHDRFDELMAKSKGGKKGAKKGKGKRKRAPPKGQTC